MWLLMFSNSFPCQVKEAWGTVVSETEVTMRTRHAGPQMLRFFLLMLCCDNDDGD